jgi:hypothetical protein
MMELKQASKDEAQRNLQSAENANTGEAMSQLQPIIRLRATGY